MEFLYVTFPVSGVETWIFIPILAAFGVSFMTSMGGISGAFILLPFQMSILGYTAPSVSATNQLFNIIATPSGIWRYIREDRMLWHLALVIAAGSLPGVFVGAWLRVSYLPDPHHFKGFAGVFLLGIGAKLVAELYQRTHAIKKGNTATPSPGVDSFTVTESRLNLRCGEYRFSGQRHSYSVPLCFLLCLVIGILGGTYGIGGGAIISPFLISFFQLPVYTVAGAALMGTLVTSVAGVLFYQFLSLFYDTMQVAPDYYLGLTLGFGGLFGIYLGARCQKHVSGWAIKGIVCFCVLFVALRYIYEYLS